MILRFGVAEDYDRILGEGVGADDGSSWRLELTGCFVSAPAEISFDATGQAYLVA